jgi:hypothetical protein
VVRANGGLLETFDGLIDHVADYYAFFVGHSRC